MKRIEARRRNASAVWLRFSQSLTSLLQRLSQANVRLDDPTAWEHHKSFGMIGALDDFSCEVRQDFLPAPLKVRSLIAAVGKEFSSRRDTFRIGSQAGGCRRCGPGCRRDEMNDGVEQQTQRIYEKVALLTFDLLACIIAMRIDTRPPFQSTLDALTIDDRGGGAGFAFALLAALHMEARDGCVIQRAVPTP